MTRRRDDSVAIHGSVVIDATPTVNQFGDVVLAILEPFEADRDGEGMTGRRP